MAVAFIGDAHGCVRHLLGACVALQAERSLILDAVVQVGDMSIARREDPTDAGHHYLVDNPAQRDGIHLMQPNCEFADGVVAALHALSDRPILFISGNHEDLNLIDECHAARPDDPVVAVDAYGAFAHVADGTVLDIAGFRVACLGGIDFPDTPWHLDPGAIAELACLPAGSIDVLVTHDGPRGIATSWRGQTQGSRILSDLIGQLQPRLHVNGHYHTALGPRPESATIGYMVAALVDPAVDPWGRNPGNPTQRVSDGSIGLLHDDGHFELVNDPWLADIAGENLDLSEILTRYA